MNLPVFDELHVMSDLHLGGAKGFQIFTSTAEAAKFLETLGRIETGRIGLGINGDLVDFLAEKGAKAFNPSDAEEKLRRIAGDSAFAPVFAGLSTFVAGANHELVINLGNHDLELALPWVRRTLIDLLASGDDAARGRITLVLDGSGFRAMVGRAKILCLHGNEVDPWNVTEYEKLRKQGRDLVQGKTVNEWLPNAGSRMVAEVMNTLKESWAFVDLLKPETKAVPLVLMALDSTLIWKLKDIAVLKGIAAEDERRISEGLLGEPAATRTVPTLNLLAAEEDRFLRKLGSQATGSAAASLLDATEKDFTAGRRSVDLLAADHSQQYLGKMTEVWAGITGWLREARGEAKEWADAKRVELLRKALECLVEDCIFDLDDAKDETFQSIDAMAGEEFDVVITGHTHLERTLSRKKGGGYYYNSGTWAGLIRIEPDILSNDAKFKAFYERLRKGNLGALEEHPSLIMRPNSVVSITSDPDGVTRGRLQHMKLNKSGRLAPEAVRGSEKVIT